MKLRLALWSIIPILLSVPLIAMQFTDEVQWGVFDFIFMGVLMCAIASAIEFMLGRSRNRYYRAGAVLAIMTAFLLIWGNAAVGLIGSGEDNIFYFAVFAAGLVGAVGVKFEARGMAKTLVTMAVIQALIPVIVFGSRFVPWDFRAVPLSAFFYGAVACVRIFIP